MKKILFILMLLIATTSYAQEDDFAPNGTSQISVDAKEKEFGKISEKNGIVEHCFIIKNISDKPFIMNNVTTSCGCTIPSYSKEPLMPGDSTKISVRYDPRNRPGYFSKRIYIWSGPDGVSNVLFIKGYVVK
ncbi:MAG: DUF1573 domain-containing protein [Rikenellaceae bacterium]